MESGRIDRLTTSLAHLLSRRTLAGAMGLGALWRPDRLEAKKKGKHKSKRREKKSPATCG